MRQLFKHVPVLDTGARGATMTFIERGIGDVLLAWENEALLTVKELDEGMFEIVVPPSSILAEPPINFHPEDGNTLGYILGHFRDLSMCRGVGMSGALALTHQEIAAWSTLTRTRLSGLELAVLRELDKIFMEGLREDGS